MHRRLTQLFTIALGLWPPALHYKQCLSQPLPSLLMASLLSAIQGKVTCWKLGTVEKWLWGGVPYLGKGSSGQERCHLLEPFYASLAKVTWGLVCWVANGSLIHTKSGCFQQQIDLLQRFGFTMRASS